jgi:glycosyltransferase involved in cell wall biosynthesis
MKKVLFISYFYPPQRGIGGKRIFRWARQLAAQFETTVLTTPPPPANECDMGQETTSEGVRVLRSYCPEWLWRLYYRTNEGVKEQVSSASEVGRRSWLAKVEEVVHRYYPLDPKIWFAPFALFEALRIAREDGVDAAVVTAAPVSSFLVGLGLDLVGGVPWIADFRDPWSFNFEQKKKASAMQWIESLIESRVMHSASHVIFASDNTRKKYCLIYPALSEKFTTLYSGASLSAEPSTSAGVSASATSRTWVHFGTFYGPRKLGVFIDALAEVIAEENLSADGLRLLLMGNAAESDLERARALGIESFIEVRGMVPYEEGLKVLEGADVLLYCDPGREPFFVAGKFFDYLRARRPIFALSASDEINGLIERHRLGVVCDPDQLDAMKRAIKGWLQTPSYEPVAIEELSAAHSAKQLGDLLSEIARG